MTLAVGPAVAEAASKQKPLRVTLEDLGTLQLVAHDLFRIDRGVEENLENGALDLSTIFDHGESSIALGGEVRNRENIMVFSAAKKIADEYQNLVSKGLPPEQARKIVIITYQAAVRLVITRLLPDSAIKGEEGEVTMTESLAFRTIHDLIPGEIMFKGEKVSIFDPSLRGKTLSKKDLRQLGAPLDGEYDAALRNIVFSPTFTVDLLERDSSLATQFSTDFTLEHFLSELEDGRFDRGEDVTNYIRSMFAKAFSS